MTLCVHNQMCAMFVVSFVVLLLSVCFALFVLFVLCVLCVCSVLICL